MSTITCKVPAELETQLAELALRRGVSRSALVREALEAKLAAESGSVRPAPANLIEALGNSVGSVASAHGDLARNPEHLQGYGR